MNTGGVRGLQNMTVTNLKSHAKSPYEILTRNFSLANLLLH